MFISEPSGQDEDAAANRRRSDPGDSVCVSWAWIPSGVLDALGHLCDVEYASLAGICEAMGHEPNAGRRRLEWMQAKDLVRIDVSHTGNWSYEIRLTGKGRLVHDIMHDLALALDRDPQEILDTFSDAARDARGPQSTFRTGWDIFNDRLKEASP